MLMKVHRPPFFAAGCVLAVALATSACSAQTPEKAKPAVSPAKPDQQPSTPRSNGDSHPKWPTIDIAQREFSGAKTFMENDNGAWRVWVLSSVNGNHREALDFMTGTRESITAEGQQLGFTDSHGHEHRPTGDAGFDAGDPRQNVGSRYFGENFLDFFGDPLYLDGFNGACPLELNVVRKVESEGDDPKALSGTWRKIPMYLAPPSEDCPSGQWRSQINSALDLDDGTMLVTMESYVFRLRMSDLAPVGAAPALQIVDADAVEALVKRAKSESVRDPNAYLTTGLKLPTGAGTTNQDKESSDDAGH